MKITVRLPMSKTKEYCSWVQMRSRCRNHKDYAGRGIKVCERWQVFDNFFADMGLAPTPKHTLGRLNNNGNYEPGNCEWQTQKTQMRNTRSTKLVTFRDETKPLATWCEELGLPYARTSMRLANGWTVEDAFMRTEKYNRRVWLQPQDYGALPSELIPTRTR